MLSLRVFVVCFVMMSGVSVAQSGNTSEKDAEKAFRDSVVKQQLVLRTFPTADEVHAKWDGSEMTWNGTPWHELGVFLPDKVTFEGAQVTLTGQRLAVMKTEHEQLGMLDVRQPMTVVVDISGEEEVAALHGLKGTFLRFTRRCPTCDTACVR